MNLPVLVSEQFQRQSVVRTFEAAGIETRPILAGNLLRHAAMARLHYRVDPAGYPVADHLMRDGFMIGCHGPADVALAHVSRALEALKVAA